MLRLYLVKSKIKVKRRILGKMELIKVINKKDEQLVNARELHKFLESKTQYTDWFYSQAERAMLEKN